MNQDANPRHRSTLIYDGDCSLCRQFTDFLKKWDRDHQFDFRPLQDEKVYVDFPQLSKEECHKAIHLVESHGAVFRGAEIIEPLLLHFPKVKSIAWMLGLPGVRSASQVVYEFVAKHRHKISKICPNCSKDDETNQH